MFEVVIVTYVVLIYYIEDDFFGIAFLYFLYLVERFLLSDAGAVFIVGILIYMIFIGFGVVLGINIDYNILYVKAIG